jgi:hypothetical protein
VSWSFDVVAIGELKLVRYNTSVYSMWRLGESEGSLVQLSSPRTLSDWQQLLFKEMPSCFASAHAVGDEAGWVAPL